MQTLNIVIVDKYDKINMDNILECQIDTVFDRLHLIRSPNASDFVIVKSYTDGNYNKIIIAEDYVETYEELLQQIRLDVLNSKFYKLVNL